RQLRPALREEPQVSVFNSEGRGLCTRGLAGKWHCDFSDGHTYPDQQWTECTEHLLVKPEGERYRNRPICGRSYWRPAQQVLQSGGLPSIREFRDRKPGTVFAECPWRGAEQYRFLFV